MSAHHFDSFQPYKVFDLYGRTHTERDSYYPQMDHHDPVPNQSVYDYYNTGTFNIAIPREPRMGTIDKMLPTSLLQYQMDLEEDLTRLFANTLKVAAAVKTSSEVITAGLTLKEEIFSYAELISTRTRCDHTKFMYEPPDYYSDKGEPNRLLAQTIAPKLGAMVAERSQDIYPNSHVETIVTLSGNMQKVRVESNNASPLTNQLKVTFDAERDLLEVRISLTNMWQDPSSFQLWIDPTLVVVNPELIEAALRGSLAAHLRAARTKIRATPEYADEDDDLIHAVELNIVESYSSKHKK